MLHTPAGRVSRPHRLVVARVGRVGMLLVLAGWLAASAPCPAAAKVGVGPRVGVTMDPDQIHFGLHLDAGNFSPRVRFQPNLEVGIGDDRTLFAFNFEAAYRFRENWDVWTPYAGGGVGINVVNFDDDIGGDDSDTDVGLNLLGGIEKGTGGGDRFFLELKLGLVDSPDFKITVGWTFM
jgi:hypothetical protein